MKKGNIYDDCEFHVHAYIYQFKYVSISIYIYIDHYIYLTVLHACLYNTAV